jgi:hypothetical protein
MEERARMALAILAIMRIRYAAFCEHFGRDPEPHEPLLFDPREDVPTAASLEDQALQIESAAMLSNVDADFVLNYLALVPLN